MQEHTHDLSRWISYAELWFLLKRAISSFSALLVYSPLIYRQQMVLASISKKLLQYTWETLRAGALSLLSASLSVSLWLSLTRCLFSFHPFAVSHSVTSYRSALCVSLLLPWNHQQLQPLGISHRNPWPNYRVINPPSCSPLLSAFHRAS